jgi:hypothetical protein
MKAREAAVVPSPWRGVKRGRESKKSSRRRGSDCDAL